MIYRHPGFCDASDAADFDAGNRHDYLWSLVFGLWSLVQDQLLIHPKLQLGDQRRRVDPETVLTLFAHDNCSQAKPQK